MSDAVQTAVSGLALGSVYALMALGLTIVYRSTTVVNFMQGQSLLLGGVLAFVGVVSWGLPYLFVAAVAIFLVFCLGMAISKVVFEPLLKAPHLSQVFATFAIVFIITGIVRYFLPDERGLPPLAGTSVIRLGDASIRAQDVLTIVLLAVVAVGFAYLFHRTHLGRLLRASTESIRGCEMSGINVRRLFAVMWGVGGALGALAGILAGPVLLVSPEMGTQPLLLGFAAMTLGGFGSFPGAIVGGLLVGLAHTVTGFYVSSRLGEVAGFILILLVLLLRPQGLFGTEDVA